MRHDIPVARLLLIPIPLMLLASGALAQTGAAGIAGVARDPSGAVLPGVTVEASSPALIERVRVVITDGEGQYKIVSLPPGTYAVTFSLTGFNVLRRDGVELTANFTATVNGDLKVGALEETVTVSGQSPVVDVQNAATRNQISRETLDTVPTNKTLEAYAALTPGMTMAATGQDVGGSKGETYVQLQIHGSRTNDNKTLIDGFETNDWSGRVFVPNPTAAHEISVELGNGLGEAPANGVYVNYVPTSGSNAFHSTFIGNYTGSGMQSAANLSADLQSRGLIQAALPKIQKIWDANGSIGGPLRKDKLWFFTAARSWGSNGTVVGTYYTATAGTPFRFLNNAFVGGLAGGNPFIYAPDKSRPAFNDFNQGQSTTRGTWQVSPRNKIEVSYDWEYRCDCHRSISPTLTPEASAVRTYHPKIPTVTWSFPATSRLLFEAGTASIWLDYGPWPQPETDLFTISVLEQTGNVRFLGTPPDTTGSGGLGDKYNFIQNSRASMSYVTGSHAIKIGMQIRTGVKKFGEEGAPIEYRVQNGVPNQVTLYSYPLLFHENMKAVMGVYAQDQWTLKRLTVSGGLRFDYENAYVPAQHLDAGAFIPARDYGEVSCVPCWKDLSPRVSAAYDLFGSAKTALKVSVGRYTAEEMLNTAHNNNPLLLSNSSTNRFWSDSTYPAGDPRRGNYIPDCDFSNPASNGECGPSSNPNFGKVVVNNSYATEVLRANRPYNWATSVSAQHELRPGVAASVAYFRTSWHNFTVADAQGVAPADYSQFCTTIPNDPRLPGAGQPLCGLYDVDPSKFGLDSTSLVTRIASGSYSDVYNGVDVTVNARLGRGAFVQGGLNTGRETTTSCDPVDSPSGAVGIVPQPVGSSAATLTTRSVNPTSFCAVTPPFWHPQWKFSGSYPLPYGFQMSAVLQSLPGIPKLASLVVGNAQVQGLGRPLAGNVANVTVTNIIAPMTVFEDRLNQLDVRFIRNFRISGMRIQGTLDIYNAFNEAAVLAENYQFGATWRSPLSVLDARIFKVGVQMVF
jgi:carboxypeptidase family protein